ncbi:hypothetical protein EJB05_34122 [Eragrostis curvula]|uniref:Uncharacterized protein n=1 Tax=Eragrostis curvula TaxID=38414 RepID=A0A5J9U3D0_9POAL|nr:hypothetical protein EJB05_34122 [Eragrostis curvula]
MLSTGGQNPRNCFPEKLDNSKLARAAAGAVGAPHPPRARLRRHWPSSLRLKQLNIMILRQIMYGERDCQDEGASQTKRRNSKRIRGSGPPAAKPCEPIDHVLKKLNAMIDRVPCVGTKQGCVLFKFQAIPIYGASLGGHRNHILVFELR